MSMYELFIENLDGEHFDSVEDYNARVLQISRDIEEELGKAERWALTHDSEVYDQLGVTIKGEYPEEDEE